MFEEMIEHIIPHLRRDIQVYFDVNPGIDNYNNRRGEVGERFIGRTMKYVLMEYGFTWGEGPCGFTITSHYPRLGANEIDFRVDIFDSEGRTQIFYIEVKNYSDTHDMTPARFRRNILNKFTENDPHHEGMWMVTLNHRHIEQIEDLCNAHHIEIIPLDVILTTTTTQTIPPTVEEFTRAIRAFFIRFMEIIQGHLEDFHCRKPDPLDLRDFVRRRYFIQKGVPYLDFCSRFGLDPEEYRGNYDKLVADMRKEGLIPRPDGRTKAGRALRGKMKEL
ncbi:MAG: hypothetical protein JW840_03255 [Candidatus Thermoplasmatota archaeon]|nr:hypothetical protein [Candidatus Thermoplasmatota archaeon]